VDPRPFIPPSDPQSFERVAAALLTADEEYKRITTPAIKGDGRMLFFSGCNIYYQPNLLLTAMDILDLISDDWTFLPGLNHCCGSNYDSAGRLMAGSKALEGLASAMRETEFETIVVWCSTCALRLHHDGFDLPVISFARLAADHLGSLLPGKSFDGGVTLQEPCKDAYLDMDPDAPREVLKLVAGEPVREMIRHGRDTVCCGWALRQHQPKVWNENMKERMAEAEATGAQTLATVCHGCQWIMDRPQTDTGLRVVNYLRLVGEAFGIHHRERFRELRELGSPEAAIDFLREEMGDRFDHLPFDRDQIRETVEILLEGFYGT
jgi:Fe-S oxidoreductase